MPVSTAQQFFGACGISLFSWFPSSRVKLEEKKCSYSGSKAMLEPCCDLSGTRRVVYFTAEIRRVLCLLLYIFRDMGPFSLKQEMALPWAQGGEFRIRRGHCSLSSRWAKKPGEPWQSLFPPRGQGSVLRTFCKITSRLSQNLYPKRRCLGWRHFLPECSIDFKYADPGHL